MDTEHGPISPMSFHLPLTLLSLAIGVFLAAQIGSVDRSGKTMRWQLDNLGKQKTQLIEAQAKMDELIKQREDLVKQSSAVQQQYTALLTDVLDLAKDDEDAKKVVQKWGIQRQAGGEAKATETPAAAPAAGQ